MATTTFTIHHARAGDYRGTDDMDAREVVTRAANFLVGCQSGAHGATAFEAGNVPASQTVTLSGASGEITVYVGRGSVAVTADGGDDATATALAFLFNANTDLNPEFVATVEGNVVTITASCSGMASNHVAIASTGTGIVLGGDYLSGGVSTTYNF